jgi:hypothetical protein
MPIRILRRVFVACVARAICASKLTRIWDEAVYFAEQICEAMEFDYDPAAEVEADCRVLWLEFFELHQFHETPYSGESYANLAREMLRKVVSASLPASSNQMWLGASEHEDVATAASDEYVREILRGIKDEEHECPEPDAGQDASGIREPGTNDDPG